MTRSARAGLVEAYGGSHFLPLSILGLLPALALGSRVSCGPDKICPDTAVGSAGVTVHPLQAPPGWAPQGVKVDPPRVRAGLQGGG